MRRSGIYSAVVLFLLSVSVLAQSLEDKMGNETFEMIRSTQGFYDDEALLGFVTRVGKKLEEVMPENDYEFKYYLIDSQEPNAFATMGGYVYVTRGLLAIIDTEDELACVLGHEFTHVLEKHSNKKMKRHFVPAIMELPGNLVGSLFAQNLGALMNLPIELVSQPVGAAFDRKQENRADAGGIDLALKAGYDPYALSSALSKLEDFLQVIGASNGQFSIFLDHPITKHRVEHINTLLEDKELPESVPSTIYSYTDGLLVGQNPSGGLLMEGNKFVHPDLAFVVQLPADWKVENTPAALRAVNKKKNAGLVFGVNGDYNSAKDAVIAFREKANDKQLNVVYDEDRLINGYNAHVIKVESTGKNPAEEIVVWIEMLGVNGVLQFTATAVSEADNEKLAEAIGSFRPLEHEERKMVMQRTLHYGTSNGATLEQFAKAESVEDNIKWLEILNGKKSNEKLEEGVVKYVRTEPYE